MNEKSALRKFLGQWRGRPYSEKEAKAGIALDALVGQQAVVTVAHNQVDDKVYANVFAIRRLGPNDVPMTAAPYERSARWAAEARGAGRGHERCAASHAAQPDGSAPAAGRARAAR